LESALVNDGEENKCHWLFHNVRFYSFLYYTLICLTPLESRHRITLFQSFFWNIRWPPNFPFTSCSIPLINAYMTTFNIFSIQESYLRLWASRLDNLANSWTTYISSIYSIVQKSSKVYPSKFQILQNQAIPNNIINSINLIR
jgi:hypothetical protein